MFIKELDYMVIIYTKIYLLWVSFVRYYSTLKTVFGPVFGPSSFSVNVF